MKSRIHVDEMHRPRAAWNFGVTGRGVVVETGAACGQRGKAANDISPHGPVSSPWPSEFLQFNIFFQFHVNKAVSADYNYIFPWNGTVFV